MSGFTPPTPKPLSTSTVDDVDDAVDADDEVVDVELEEVETTTTTTTDYSWSKDAAENFLSDAEARIRDLESQLEEAKADKDRWQETVDSFEDGE